MHHIYLVKTLETQHNNIKIYSTNGELNIDSIIDNMMSDILSAPYPRQISDLILSIGGVNLIEIFDKDNNTILVTSNILPEDISYHDE
jgi:hypothetical protein